MYPAFLGGKIILCPDRLEVNLLFNGTVLGRLAVDRSYQGRGLGRSLFRDAAHRVAHAAGAIGIRGIVVHAISAEARKFYIALAFDPCPDEAMTLVVMLRDLRGF
jgi:GNAT superfamily N-acetyltransferase